MLIVVWNHQTLSMSKQLLWLCLDWTGPDQHHVDNTTVVPVNLAWLWAVPVGLLDCVDGPLLWGYLSNHRILKRSAHLFLAVAQIPKIHEWNTYSSYFVSVFNLLCHYPKTEDVIHKSIPNLSYSSSILSMAILNILYTSCFTVPLHNWVQQVLQ